MCENICNTIWNNIRLGQHCTLSYSSLSLLIVLEIQVRIFVTLICYLLVITQTPLFCNLMWHRWKCIYCMNPCYTKVCLSLDPVAWTLRTVWNLWILRFQDLESSLTYFVTLGKYLMCSEPQLNFSSMEWKHFCNIEFLSFVFTPQSEIFLRANTQKANTFLLYRFVYMFGILH